MVRESKKVLSVLICVVILLALAPQFQLPATALGTYAARSQETSQIVAQGICGDNARWELDALGTLSITGSGAMHNYYYDDNTAPWDQFRHDIQSVIIHSGITSIGEHTFDKCSSLINVTIMDGVTSIGDFAFSTCRSLTSVSIPNSMTSIGDSAFSNCNSLTDITIPESMTSIGFMTFFHCTSLTNITIPDSVTRIGHGAFYHCTSLTSITIPDSVTRIDSEAFAWCSSLTNVTVPDSVTSINDKTFYSCTNLTDITIPDSVTGIEYGAFDFCDNLKDVYYAGTETKWNSICIGGDNFPLTMATIHYNYRNENAKPENGAKKSIAVFSTEKSLSVNTGGSMWLAFGIMNMDTGLIETDWRKMAIVVSNPTVLSLSDYEETEYGYSLEVIGKKQGTTNVTITDTETGIHTAILITVRDYYVQTYSYAIDNMHTFYPNNKYEDHIKTNIYDLNGMYVNNYHSIENANGSHVVTFDVYNSKYYYGAVDIYDENGMWLGFEEIKKYSGIDSVYDTLEQTYFLLSECVSSITSLGKETNLLTYQQASFSIKTEIEIEVPKNGYFTISNNVSESPGTFVVNSLEILFDAAFTAADVAISGVDKTSAFDDILKDVKKDFTQRLIDARNESLKNEVKRKAQKVLISSVQSKVEDAIKDSVKSDIIDQITVMNDTQAELADLLESSLLKEYKIDWRKIFGDTFGLGESFFAKFAGPAGVALKGCFAITKGSNKLLMVSQLAWSANKPYVTVYSNIDDGYINPHGIIVDTAGNVDAETVLQVFKVSNNESVEDILNSNNPLEKYDLYNICFVKDDQLVQPNGKVTVRIPVPEGMDRNTCKVYRQEDDRIWTILDAHIEGNYLVFETDHFSLYTVVGNMDNISIHSMPNKTVYTEGDPLDTNGLVLALNGELISEGYLCNPAILSGVGNVTITVQYGNATTTFDVTVNPSGYAVSGNVESFGNQGDSLTLRLIDALGVVKTISTSSSSYTFENVTAGTYTLEASKANHVTRTYEITVTDQDVDKDVKIHLIGDIDGNGQVNVGDISKFYAHIRSTAQLTDEYQLLCANVNGGSLNVGDVSAIYAHIKGTKKLY